jgi:mitochondrial fission protein ELM1
MVTKPVTWVLTDGKIGMVTQAMGLAQAVGFDTVAKTIRPAAPWKWLPAGLWPARASGIGRGSDSMDGDPPDLVISCGRHAVGPALWLKRRHRERPFLVHVQHPRINPALFDLIIAPLHDALCGPNVMQITGSLHGVTQAKLAAAAERFGPAYRAIKRPVVAVLVGGSNSVYDLTEATVERLITGLKRLAEAHGAGLLVTLSRRTGPAAEKRLREALAGVAAEIWSGGGENPYLGYLALAEAIVVTCDSVNMISEACATGKPVYIAELPGRGNSKFAAFHDRLFAAGMARPFDGSFARWSYQPLDDTARAATEVRRRMGIAP